MGRGRIGGNVVGRQRNGGRRREAENQNKGERRESCHWPSPTSIRNGTAGAPALDAMIAIVLFGIGRRIGKRRRNTSRYRLDLVFRCLSQLPPGVLTRLVKSCI